MMDAGGRIGNIRLVETLGEGGMGTVWAGFDEKLRREVAVKTLRSDRVDLETRARLLAEARILSQLEHPGICRLYDYVEGEDSDYLVLERIRGRTLRQVIESGGNGGSDKLRIAEQIAGALAVAHARGIVHRDLKPANVMLADGGDSGADEIKVLDFGLSRSLHMPEEGAGAAGGGPRRRSPPPGPPRPGDGTLTRLGSLLLDGEAGAVLGTPANMSPEQARGEPTTPASDMYSFGLLLQELFTGQPVYPPELAVDRLLAKAADGDTLPVAGVDREVEALIEDLLDLAPEARPAASETAARLRRIRQRPRRRRRALFAAALGAAILAAGVKYTVDLKRERDQVIAARQEAQELADFLTGLLEASDPWTPRSRDLTVRELLDRGAARVDRELVDQPAVRARLLLTVGVVYTSLELFAEARPFLERALVLRRELYGEEHPEVAESLHALGELQMLLWELGAAGPVLRQALAQRRAFGEPREVAESLDILAAWHLMSGAREAAEPLLRESLDVRSRLGGPHSVHAPTVVNLSGLLISRGEIEESESLLRRGLEQRRRLRLELDPQLALLAKDLGEVLAEGGRLEEAERLHREAVAIYRDVLGGEHSTVALSQTRLAEVLRQRGDLEAARTLHREALTISRQALGEGHCKIGFQLGRFARVLLDQGDLGAAETALTEARAIQLRCREHWSASVGYDLGRLRAAQGDPRRAETVLRQALAALGETLPPHHWAIRRVESLLGAVLSELGRPDEAEPLLLRACTDLRINLGDRSEATRDALSRLAAFYETWQRPRP